MKVIVSNRQKDLKINKNSVSAIVKKILLFENKKCDEVGVHFVDLNEISSLHERFFGDSSPTDCISLPLESFDEYILLGDIFVCPQVALNYAREHDESPYEELTLYVVHALLHLMGYDDIQNDDRAAMEAAQRQHMRRLADLNLVILPSKN